MAPIPEINIENKGEVDNMTKTKKEISKQVKRGRPANKQTATKKQVSKKNKIEAYFLARVRAYGKERLHIEVPFAYHNHFKKDKSVIVKLDK